MWPKYLAWFSCALPCGKHENSQIHPRDLLYSYPRTSTAGSENKTTKNQHAMKWTLYKQGNKQTNKHKIDPENDLVSISIIKLDYIDVIAPLYSNNSCFGVQIVGAAHSCLFFSFALNFFSFIVKVRNKSSMLFFWSVWKQFVKYFESMY